MRKRPQPTIKTRQKSVAIKPGKPLKKTMPSNSVITETSSPPNAKKPAYNHLYFGDCLEVLKDLAATHKPFIDLIYIDPPFNSKRNYNILFESISFDDANAQKHAFADTWSNVMYIVELQNLAELHKDLYELLSFFDKSKCVSDSAVAYLTTMSIRLVYMHKLLKDTGSFYLHCDPTMSHYLKLICDMIFGEKNFRNEISWCYRKWAINQKQFASNHDVLLFYAKSNRNTFMKMESDWRLLKMIFLLDRQCLIGGKYQS